jgi:hypothetical protein
MESQASPRSSPLLLGALLFGLGGAVGYAVHALGGRGELTSSEPSARAVAALSPPLPALPPASVIAPVAELQLPTALPDAPRLKPGQELEAAQLLERARGLVDSNPQAALELAAEHDRTFPDGRLRGEAALIAARALVALGDPKAAKQRARAALAEQPNGPYAKQLHGVIAAK